MKGRWGSLGAVGLALLALGLTPACGVHEYFTIDGKGDLSSTPPGTCAVLRVTARPAASPKGLQKSWATIDTPNADRSFAELLAHAARDEAGLPVLLPYDANQQLQKAKLKPSLQPTGEELRKYVQTLGCSSYLTADVSAWSFGYIYLVSHSRIRYTIACHRADTGEVVWEATVKRQVRGMSDRDTARLALRETFGWFREGRPRVPPGPPEEQE